MIRILLLLALVYLLYRLWTRLYFFLSKTSRSSQDRGEKIPWGKAGPSGKGRVFDEMRRCPNCGTYNPSQLALHKKGLYFCNQGCHEAYDRREQS